MRKLEVNVTVLSNCSVNVTVPDNYTMDDVRGAVSKRLPVTLSVTEDIIEYYGREAILNDEEA